MYSFRWLAGAFVVLAALWTGPLGAAEVAGLDDYIKVKDAAYSWKLAAKVTVPLLERRTKSTSFRKPGRESTGTTNWSFTSQQGPQGPRPCCSSTRVGLLGRCQYYGIYHREKVGAPIAILFGIPNQPLYDGKKRTPSLPRLLSAILRARARTDLGRYCSRW